MKNTFPARGLTALIAAAFISQGSMVHAGMIEPEAAALPAQSQAEQDRAKVQAFVERANVAEKMKAMGVNGLFAKSRVDALTEAEVHALADRIDAMPAGGALSNNDLIIILLIALLVAVLI